MNIKEQCILYDAPIFNGKIVGWKMSRPNWHKEKSAEYGKKKVKIEKKIANEGQEIKKKRIKYEDLVFRIFLKGFDYCNSFYFGLSYKKILSKYKNPYLVFVLSKIELIPFEYMSRICNNRTLGEFERDVKDARDYFLSNLQQVSWNLALNQVYDYIKQKERMEKNFKGKKWILDNYEMRLKRRKLVPVEEDVLIDHNFLTSHKELLVKREVEKHIYSPDFKREVKEHIYSPDFTIKKVQNKVYETVISEEETEKLEYKSLFFPQEPLVKVNTWEKNLIERQNKEMERLRKILDEEHVHSYDLTVKSVILEQKEKKFPGTKRTEKELKEKREKFVITTWTSIFKKEILFQYLDLFYKDESLKFLNAIPFHSCAYNNDHRYIDAFINAKTLYGDLRQASYINMDVVSLFLNVEKKMVCALRSDKIVIFEGSVVASDGEDLTYKAYKAIDQGLSYAYFMTDFEKRRFDFDVKEGNVEFDKSYSKKNIQETFFSCWDEVLKSLSNAILKRRKIFKYHEKIKRIVDFRECYPSPRANFWDQYPSKNDP